MSTNTRYPVGTENTYGLPRTVDVSEPSLAQRVHDDALNAAHQAIGKLGSISFEDAARVSGVIRDLVGTAIDLETAEVAR